LKAVSSGPEQVPAGDAEAKDMPIGLIVLEQGNLADLFRLNLIQIVIRLE